MDGLRVAPGKRFIDATYGGGGHTRAIEGKGARVLGIDADPDTGVIQGNFRDIEEIAKKHAVPAGRQGFDTVDGILFDLGVSSHQLDTPERGFSFRFEDAPLDLRLNQTQGITAAEYINSISENELYETLATYSEQDNSRTIAHAIVRARPITTTGDLLKIVRKNQAPQIFQALRIEVNDELGALKEGLVGAKKLLKQGGRLVVISFHSLEDRIVKAFMREDGWKVITKKPVVPSDQEQFENKRSRSAKLRIAERL